MKGLEQIHTTICNHFKLSDITQSKKAKMFYIVMVKHVRNCTRPYITNKEIAKTLGVHENTIQNLYKHYEDKKPLYYEETKTILTKLFEL